MSRVVWCLARMAVCFALAQRAAVLNSRGELDEAMALARRLLEENAAAVDALAARLWPHPVTLPGPEVLAVLESARAVPVLVPDSAVEAR